MRRLFLAVTGALALAAASMLLGQTPGRTPAKTWKVARTPDGQPDLQGYWTNLTLTPLERPKGLGSKEFYTDEEIAAAQKRERERLALNIADGRPTEPGTADD